MRRRGFEKEVFLGAREMLRSVLGVESETNFDISPTYPMRHFGTLQQLLLDAHLLTFDLSCNRVPRASFVRALASKGDGPRRARRPWQTGDAKCAVLPRLDR